MFDNNQLDVGLYTNSFACLTIPLNIIAVNGTRPSWREKKANCQTDVCIFPANLIDSGGHNS